MDKFFTKDNPNYPKLLKEIKDVPKQLYYKGNWSNEIFENCLAVVGSRRMTSYGKQMVERLIGEIALSGITVISGFMYGVDATAHQATVRVGGKTIAVMPCGINIISPAYQENLYFEIIKNNGLIISEYEKDKKPELWTYPRRNRIVAGLAKAVLVVEAGPKSGSLITANYAKKFKRKLFSLPGPANSEVSKGTLQLIKEGATMVTSAKDILDYFRKGSEDGLFSSSPLSAPRPATSRFTAPKPHDSKSSFSSHPALEKKILNELQREPMEIDVLSRNLKIPTAKLGSMLSLLQLKGIIIKDGNKYKHQ